ncbi:hypothetical protein BDN70DRAFT_990288 [Pholiota conissans]|uniref:ABC transmembrane type-1 domain-containing protein n=1 Tax=Pholiota conissans TaxID=109636 RepID=A0A9P5ZB24_9AGAR|nr:hypothetical protein BDN70DRAFT_990288 [Pholiota conissans]
MTDSNLFVYQAELENNFLSVATPIKLPLDDVRSIPFIVAVASLGFQAIHLIAYGVRVVVQRKRTSVFNESEAETQPARTGFFEKWNNHVAFYGGHIIFAFILIRFAGSAFLLHLSGNTIRATCSSGVDSLGECPEVFWTVTFLCSTLLGLISVLSKTRSTSATRYNIVILLSALSLYLYRDVWPLATYEKQPADSDEGPVLVAKIIILMFIAILIPLFIPRRYIPVDPKDPMPVPNPEQTASIFSLATFTFLDPVIFLGSKVKHLSFRQIPALADYDSAEYTTKRAFPYLDVFAGARPRHLFFRLMRVFIKEYMVMLVTLLFYTLGAFVSPIGIYKVLNYLETGGEGQSIKPWVWVIWLFLGPMIQSMCFQWYLFTATHVLALCEILVTELVFEHSLRIRLKADASRKTESRMSTGDTCRADSPGSKSSENAAASSPADNSEDSSIVDREASTTSDGPTIVRRDPSTSTSTLTLKGTVKAKGKQNAMAPPAEDSKKKSDGNLVGKINNLVTSDLNNITGARDFLWLLLGVPLNIGLCLAFLYRLLGWSTFVGFGVTIALLPLPGYVAKKIQQTQSQRMKHTDARVQAVSEAMSIIRMVKLFGWEDKMSERLKAKREEELKLVWKLKLLNWGSAMLYFPDFHHGCIIWSVHRTSNRNLPIAASLPEAPSSLEIGFHNASFAWTLDEESDSGMATPSSRVYRLRVEGDLLFKRNAINLIIGPTGSGKTSILMALLGEMHFVPMAPDLWFNLPRSGGIAYAAQESWVQNDTIRNNILFGSDYNEERYNKVIKQCALEHDLELFDAGDATEVGERGLTLSGGQKARVTLARVIYSPAEIILLDDVLAALDVHTST